MPDVQLRLAKSLDASAIASVLYRSFLEFKALYTPAAFAATTPNREQIEGRLQEGPIWVALRESEIVGTVSVVPQGKAVYIRSMAILPSARGQELGWRLLAEVEGFAFMHGYRRLILSTTPFLTRAIRLYENFGFRRIDEGANELFGTPLFSMVKTLESKTKTRHSEAEAVPELPPGLPVPVKDGACDHLPGTVMPRIRLPSTRGRVVDLAEVSRLPTVFLFYPATGKLGDPVPDGWDLIPGARGCTQQNCGYRDLYREFLSLGFGVYGISSDPLENQREFAQYRHIPYELLNDSTFELIDALNLPTFEFQGQRFVKRLALVVRDGKIEKVFYPVFPPGRNAEIVLEYLRDR